jgi:excinuclease ABC subunit A
VHVGDPGDLGLAVDLLQIDADRLVESEQVGTEGGAAGGTLVACGPPERVAAASNSYTARWLRPVLTSSAA